MRKPLPPATGRVKILKPLTGDHMSLRITPEGGESQVYEVFATLPGVWSLYTVKPGESEPTKYTIDRVGSSWTCSCPDATHRPERRHDCKHIRAVRAALRAQVPSDW